MSSSNSLCSICQGIHFKPWQELTKEEKKVILTCNDEYDEDEDDEDELLGDELYGESSLQYIHRLNLWTLKKSADGGCQFCYQMCYGALKDALLDEDSKTYSEAIILSLI
jgi:hypothetical protein